MSLLTAQQGARAVTLTGGDYVVVDQRYLRPAEVDLLQSDASKARRVRSPP